MNIEAKYGVHSKTRSQVSIDAPVAKQYEKFSKIDYSRCDSDKVEYKESKAKLLN